MVVQYSSFCCICSTKTGTIVIAVISLFIGTILFLDGGTNIIRSLAVEPSRPNVSTATLDETYNSEPSAASNHTDTEYFITRGVETIGGFIEAATSTLLLVGVHRDRPEYVYPWIIVSAILCVLRFITLSFIGYLFYMVDWLFFRDTSCVLPIAAAILTLTAAHVFAILIVNSFHTALKSGPLSVRFSNYDLGSREGSSKDGFRALNRE